MLSPGELLDGHSNKAKTERSKDAERETMQDHTKQQACEAGNGSAKNSFDNVPLKIYELACV
jgi:hypothetical protein